MNKTTNNYINQLKLDPKKEAAVRKLVENAVDVEAIKEEVLKIPSKFEFVDLGLPSGTKWATCNIGANSPEESGLYYQWGDTQGWSKEQIENGEKAFSWSDYKFTNDNGSTFTKYNETDGKIVLDLEDDAAYQFDNTCRTPTIDEIKELKKNTDYTLETINGVVGGKLTSRINGNSIFIPRNAYCYDGKVDIGTSGPFWSSSRSEYNNRMSDYGYITKKYLSDDSQERYLGMAIRPVQDASTPSTLVEKVDAIEEKAEEATPYIWDMNTAVNKVKEIIQAARDNRLIILANYDYNFSLCNVVYVSNSSIELEVSTYGRTVRYEIDDTEITTTIIPAHTYCYGGSTELSSDGYLEYGTVTNNITFSVTPVYPTDNDHVNLYQGDFSFDATVYTVTFPDNIKWSTDSVLEFKANHTYQFKIVNNLGVMKEFANS